MKSLAALSLDKTAADPSHHTRHHSQHTRQHQLHHQLHLAIRNRDASAVASIITQSQSYLLSSSSPSSSSSSLSSSSHSALSIHAKYASTTSDTSLLNERDTEGNSPLLLAVSLFIRKQTPDTSLISIISKLLACVKLNVNMQDWESGSTALHKALYAGRVNLALMILNARSDCDIHIKDIEGNSCLDLLNSTIDHAKLGPIPQYIPGKTLTHQDTPSESDDESLSLQKNLKDDTNPTSSATSIWTWGTNTNYILGTRNASTSSNSSSTPSSLSSHNQSINPDLLQIPRLSSSSDSIASLLNAMSPRINKIVMSKYHMAILTKCGRVLCLGFGGARLGVGHEETVFEPTIVGEDTMTSERMYDSDDEISSDVSSNSNSSDTETRTTSNIMGRISDIAVGPDHTVAVSENGTVWTWGSNRFGQLGYSTTSSRDISHPVSKPRQVVGGLKRVHVLGAAASKYHTVVFSRDGTLYSWGWNNGQLGYTQQQHQHPHQQIQSFPKKIASITTTGLEIIQVAATNTSTAILYRSETGTPIITLLSQHRVHRLTFTLPHTPTSLSFFRPADTQSSIHMTKLVSGNHQYACISKSGDVWMWSPPYDKDEFKDTWQQLDFPLSEPKRIWKAKRSFLAAYDVAIGIDSSVAIVTVSGAVFVGTRRKDVKRNPTSLTSQSKESIYFKFTPTPYLRHIQSVCASPSGAFAALRCDVLPGPWISLSDTFTRDICRQQGEEDMLSSDPFTDIKLCVRNPVSLEVITLYTHSVMLKSRSIYFRDLLNKYMRSLDLDTDTVTMTRDDIYTTIDILITTHPAAVQCVLEYVYTGKLNPEWYTQPSIYINKRELSVRDAVVILVREWGISSNIKGDVGSCWDKGGDVLIIWNEGRESVGHRLILARRCAFFEAMLGGRWGVEKRTWEGLVIYSVDVGHVKKQVGDVCLRWIYGVVDVDALFGGDLKRCKSLWESLEFLKSVIAAADELLLEDLKDIVSGVLSSMMCLGNVGVLMEISDIYQLCKLKDFCLLFTCWNLDTAIETKSIASFPPHLLNDIEQFLCQMQIRKFPYVRGPNGFFARIQQLAKEAEAEKKQRRKEEYELRKKGKEKELLSDVHIETTPPVNDTLTNQKSDLSTSMEMLTLHQNDTSIYSRSSEKVPLLGFTSVERSPRRNTHFKEKDDADAMSSDEEQKAKKPPVTDDGIFDMELEAKMKSPKGSRKKSKTHWMKIDLNESKETLNSNKEMKSNELSSSHPPKLWQLKPVLNSKVSLLEVMESEASQKAKSSPSPSTSITITSASSQNPPLVPSPHHAATPLSSSSTSTSILSPTKTNTASSKPPTAKISPALTPSKAWSSAASQTSVIKSLSTLSLGDSHLQYPHHNQQQQQQHQQQQSYSPTTIPLKVATGQSQKERRKSRQNQPPSSDQAIESPGSHAWGSASSITPPSSFTKSCWGITSNVSATSTKTTHTNSIQSNQAQLDKTTASEMTFSKMAVTNTGSNEGIGLRTSLLKPASITVSNIKQEAYVIPSSHVSFADIQRDQKMAQEQKEEKERLRRRKKALGQIQREEQAVQEISAFYRLTCNAEDGEYVSVALFC